MKILLLPNTYTSPASRFRIWQFVDPFRENGHTVEIRVIFPHREWKSNLRGKVFRKLHQNLMQFIRILHALWITRDTRKFDIVIMNRDIVPNTKISFIETFLYKRKNNLIFDFDDAIHLGPRERKLENILPKMAWITPGNAILAQFASQHNRNITVIPTVVNTDFYVPSKSRIPGPLRIGWSGSAATNRYCLPLLEGPIKSLVKYLEFEFVIISNVNPNVNWYGVTSKFLEWTPESEVQNLQLFDIGLMPLKDSEFERGKCGLKAIQYMGVGIPSLVSPVGVNREIIRHSTDGFHCDTEDDWVFYLRQLAEDVELRNRMGTNSRQRVIDNYSVDKALLQFEEIFVKMPDFV